MQRSVAVLAVLSALAFLAPVASSAGLTAAERTQLGKSLRPLVREPDAGKRASGLKKLDAMTRKATFEDLEAAIAVAVPGDQWNPGFSHGVKFASHGETFVYSVHMGPRRPKSINGLAPLVVDPGHISLADADERGVEDVMSTWLDVSGAGDDVIYVRCRAFDRLTLDGRYSAWAMAQRPQGKDDLDTLAAILADAIADACVRYPVDPDRVYIHGLSMTGFWAWYEGAYAPDRFAAVAPVSAVTWQVLPLLESFRATKLFVLHGENDTVCPITGARAAITRLSQLEIPVDFRPVADGEHVKNTFPLWSRLWPDVAKATRDPYPKRVSHVFHGGERAAAFWLEADGVPPRAFVASAPKCEMNGAIDGQKITIEADGMKKVRVLLSSRLVDLSKPIEIVVNKKKQFSGLVQPDAALALDVAARRADGAQAYSAAVTVSVP